MITVILFSALCFAQVRLSKSKKFWLGLLPPFLTFALSIAAATAFLVPTALYSALNGGSSPEAEARTVSLVILLIFNIPTAILSVIYIMCKGERFMDNQTVLILDFGGQYREVIARKVRELNVYAQILPGDVSAERVKNLSPIGIIFSGGPDSVLGENAPFCDKQILTLGVPILGICYGAQMIARMLGGEVEAGEVREYGRTTVKYGESPLFKGVNPTGQALMSHTDHVKTLPGGFKISASSNDCECAAIENASRKIYGVQFHPEVEHTDDGSLVLKNFLYSICGAKGDYTIDDVEKRQLAEIKRQVGPDKVLLALSGGVDSSVCAALLSKAIPGQLTCVFVDHGFMRKNEGDEIEAAFAPFDLNFIRVNAAPRFLAKLAGVSEPERKRKIIGAEFIAVFEEEARKLGDVKILAQGTIYPDVIESGANNTATIKSHHNVGGLPEKMAFGKIIEPLRNLFKDEVRALGRRLGLPAALVDRQPFPGPGLAIRVIGEVTPESLSALREADAIWREEIELAEVVAHQYFAVLTNLRSVGVMGDSRTYDRAVGLRAVTTSDFMTCQYVQVPYPVLDKASARIVNEVPGVNRVLYDCTGKPPATIEWE